MVDNTASPEVESRSHLVDGMLVVQPAEAVFAGTFPCPAVQVKAPINYNNEDTTTLYKHKIQVATDMTLEICFITETQGRKVIKCERKSLNSGPTFTAMS